jgi:hypothetical protein
MIFKVTLIFFLIIIVLITFIYYIVQYKKLFIIQSPTFMGPYSIIKDTSTKKKEENTTNKGSDEATQNAINYLLSDNVDNVDEINTYTNDKLSLYHNDYSYSYTFFIKIDDIEYKLGKDKEIFSKGERNSKNNGNYNPRIILDKRTNNIKILIDTFRLTTKSNTHDSNNYTEECVIENIPLQSWFFIGVVLNNKNLDVYINGKLLKSHILEKLPKKSKSVIKYSQKGGFDGSINKLCYYFNSLSSLEILNIFEKNKGELNNKVDTRALKLDKLSSVQGEAIDTFKKCNQI